MYLSVWVPPNAWDRSESLSVGFDGSHTIRLWKMPWPKRNAAKSSREQPLPLVAMPRLSLPGMLCWRPLIGALLIDPFTGLEVEWSRGEVRVHDTQARAGLAAKAGSWLERRLAPGLLIEPTTALREFLRVHKASLGVETLGVDSLSELLFVGYACAREMGPALDEL
jgi:hypothetical protein